MSAAPKTGPGTGLRIGVTGCGAIGALHAKNLRAAGADLVFHNRTRSKADDFARRFGGEAVVGLEGLLARCDAVVVATPPEDHPAAASAALAAGRPVLVEKPLCASAEDLRRIEAAANAAPASTFVMVAENYYYKPSLLWMREVVTWAGVGAVTEIELKKLTRQATAGWKDAWGALLEGGIHFVALGADLADAAGAMVHPEDWEDGGAAEATDGDGPGAALTEPPEVHAPLRTPAEVHAEFPTARRGGPERQARLECVYEDGLRLRLHYAWDVPSLTKGVFQHSTIVGAAGRIWFESNGIYAHLRGPGRKGWTFPGVGDLMGYGAMTAQFLDAVAAGADDRVAPYSGLVRARRDLEIVWRAYEQLP